MATRHDGTRTDKGGGGIISTVTNWLRRNSQKGSEEDEYNLPPPGSPIKVVTDFEQAYLWCAIVSRSQTPILSLIGAVYSLQDSLKPQYLWSRSRHAVCTFPTMAAVQSQISRCAIVLRGQSCVARPLILSLRIGSGYVTLQALPTAARIHLLIVIPLVLVQACNVHISNNGCSVGLQAMIPVMWRKN